MKRSDAALFFGSRILIRNSSGVNPDSQITRKLIESIRRNDRKAQTLLYGQYCRAMYSTSLRILNNPEDAEDAMQEGFIDAFKSIAAYDGSVSFGAWLRRIVINRSIDLLRKRKDYLSFEDIQFTEGEQESEPEFEGSRSIELITKIKQVMSDLPDGYRLVLSLHLFEGLDHDEIGTYLGISPATSRSQYARARRKLLEDLSKLKIEPVYESI